MISKKVSNLLWNHCALCTASRTDNAQRRCYYQTINLAVMVASLSPSTYTHKIDKDILFGSPFSMYTLGCPTHLTKSSLKFRYSEEATKFSHFLMSNILGDFFQTLWHSKNILTLERLGILQLFFFISLIKLRYSEKATQFWKNIPTYLCGILRISELY